jgi:hypothetical protein
MTASSFVGHRWRVSLAPALQGNAKTLSGLQSSTLKLNVSSLEWCTVDDLTLFARDETVEDFICPGCRVGLIQDDRSNFVTILHACTEYGRNGSPCECPSFTHKTSVTFVKEYDDGSAENVTITYDNRFEPPFKVITNPDNSETAVYVDEDGKKLFAPVPTHRGSNGSIGTYHTASMVNTSFTTHVVDNMLQRTLLEKQATHDLLDSITSRLKP